MIAVLQIAAGINVESLLESCELCFDSLRNRLQLAVTSYTNGAALLRLQRLPSLFVTLNTLLLSDLFQLLE
ncbi:hypothetical protein [Pseudomonas ogarae]